MYEKRTANIQFLILCLLVWKIRYIAIGALSPYVTPSCDSTWSLFPRYSMAGVLQLLWRCASLESVASARTIYFVDLSCHAAWNNSIYFSHFCKNRHAPYIFSLRKPHFYVNVFQ